MTPKPPDGVGQYPGGPGIATGVRPLRHLSQTDYPATQLPPSRPMAPSYSSPVSGPGVYPPTSAVRQALGQPQPAGFPGTVDCHGNPAGGLYPASSCHQQPSPVSATFTAQQPTPHNYPVSSIVMLCLCFSTFLSEAEPFAAILIAHGTRVFFLGGG